MLLRTKSASWLADSIFSFQAQTFAVRIADPATDQLAGRLRMCIARSYSTNNNNSRAGIELGIALRSITFSFLDNAILQIK